jgi:hypothetical protein
MIIVHKAIRSYIYKYVFVWVCARVVIKKKNVPTNTYEHTCMHMYIACVCVCVYARGIEAGWSWLIHDMRTRLLPPHMLYNSIESEWS